MPSFVPPYFDRPLFRRISRLIVVAAVFAFAGAISGTTDTLACGVPTHLPNSPFMDGYGNEENEGKFAYWESWGKIEISPTISFQIAVGFSPVPAAHIPSRILGVGWTFPLLESVCFPQSDNVYEIRFPSGHRQRLWKDPIVPNRFTGGDWVMRVQKEEIVAQAICGWVLTFNHGQLRKMRTPEGHVVEFLKEAQGVQRIVSGSKILLTFTPESEAKHAEDGSLLQLADGKRAVLRFGRRPALVSRSSNKGALTPEMIFRVPDMRVPNPSNQGALTPRMVNTLASVKWTGEPERRYDFKEDELKVFSSESTTNLFFKWENTRGFLLKDSTGEYSFERIQDIWCRKTVYPDGKVSLEGKNADQTIVIRKMADSPATLKLIQFPENSNLHGQIKECYAIDKHGNETLVEKNFFDSNGNLFRQILPEKVITYSPKLDEAKDAQTGLLLWSKKRDTQGRLIQYVSGKVTYAFDYNGAKTKVTVRDENNPNVKEFQIATEEIVKLFPSTRL